MAGVFLSFFLLETLILFFLSREMTKSLSTLFYNITKSQQTTIHLLAFLFLPGVVVHELAHLLVANLLLVKTGEIEFVPQISKDGVKLGSVVIAKTDPLRRMLIGVAPVIVGLLLLLSILFVLMQGNVLSGYTNIMWVKVVFYFVSLYALFVISNTMFSSKKDMEGALELVVVFILIGVLLYVLGVRFDISAVQSFIVVREEIFQKAAMLLSLPIVIDIGVLGITKLSAMSSLSK